MKLNRVSKGYTLVELTAAIVIISMLCSIGVFGSKAYNKMKNNIETTKFNNSFLVFINNSKMFCREKEQGGHILVDISNNSISFYAHEYNTGGITSRKRGILQVPKGFKLTQINIARIDKSIQIDRFGMTSDAFSFRYIDKEGGTHIISMCVGSGYVTN
ncbi:MAG: type II secretion system protein [Bacillota bacterium]|nr:type II secretion system protein [Bacillota bacterium]